MVFPKDLRYRRKAPSFKTVILKIFSGSRLSVNAVRIASDDQVLNLVIVEYA